jgi:uncharacterized protein
MIKEINLYLSPKDSVDEPFIKNLVAQELGLKKGKLFYLQLLKRSIDARQKEVKFLLKYKVYIGEEPETSALVFNYNDVHNAQNECVIIGAGPAGLFCALECLLIGIKPIIIERGKDVRNRRRDLALLNKEGLLNTESNYCFGEGGAGTYSDGKLYTRSGKRGNIEHILKQFVFFGASPEILIDAHPHIGTNKLPQIITQIREKILEFGGQILFNTLLEDITISNNKVIGIITNKGPIPCSKLVLATGHSASDVYELLHKKNITIEAKPLAIGVRVEHQQSFVDEIQYHQPLRSAYLPPASYSLVHQALGKGVFSFCMCPGGIIAPASTQHNKLVVNGWSPSKRNNAYANSGIVVAVDHEDYKPFAKYKELSALYYQNDIEANVFNAGGGKYVAPAQRVSDFMANKTSSTLPSCSYLPGINSVNINELLPKAIASRLMLGFKAFNAKMKGYIQNEAIIVATESRTSSPVRIPRDNVTLQHPQIIGLYPCGEGAGYAGGIVSAAMDGVRIAHAVYHKN